MVSVARAAPIVLVVLAACEAGPINGTRDSGVFRLELGMTPAEVGAVIGRPQMQQAVSFRSGQVCYSYLYDEMIDPRFAHVVYQDGLLITATDRHNQTCNPV